MFEHGCPLPVIHLRSLALVIARQRSSAFQIPDLMIMFDRRHKVAIRLL
jgi:hypothetical protein